MARGSKIHAHGRRTSRWMRRSTGRSWWSLAGNGASGARRGQLGEPHHALAFR